MLIVQGAITMNTLYEKEYALNNAVASVEIEGYRMSEYEKKMCMSVLEGKLTKEEFVKILLERCAACHTH